MIVSCGGAHAHSFGHGAFGDGPEGLEAAVINGHVGTPALVGLVGDEGDGEESEASAVAPADPTPQRHIGSASPRVPGALDQLLAGYLWAWGQHALGDGPDFVQAIKRVPGLLVLVYNSDYLA